MLGDNQWKRPVWEQRAVPPDGKTCQTRSFDQYLLLPAREGLELPSLLTVHKLCEAGPRRGAQAITMLRRAIKDYDKRIEADQRQVENAGRKTEKTGRPIKGTSLVPLSKGGNDRMIARLKRDAPTIWDAYMAGRHPSVRAAALAAGITKQSTPLMDLRRAWKKASEEERAAFLQAERTEIEPFFNG